MLVLPHHFDFFLHWTSVFGPHSDLYPGFISYELASAPPPHDVTTTLSGSTAASAILDWRLGDAYVLRHGSAVLVSMWSSTAYAYMLTPHMLATAVSKDSWLGALASATGEFNPRFGTVRWMHPDYRIVLPVSDLARAMLWHTPNKYVALAQAQEAAGTPQQPFFNGLSLVEAVAVFGRCRDVNLGSWLDASLINAVPLHTVGDCTCAEATAVRTTKSSVLTGNGTLAVVFSCIRVQDVLYPPEE